MHGARLSGEVISPFFFFFACFTRKGHISVPTVHSSCSCIILWDSEANKENVYCDRFPTLCGINLIDYKFIGVIPEPANYFLSSSDWDHILS